MAKNEQDSASLAKCLICGKTNEELTRGLCTTHYNRFRRAVGKIDPAEIDAYEKKLMEGGLLLPKQPPGIQVDRDVFAEIAAQFPSKRTDADVSKAVVKELVTNKPKPAATGSKSKRAKP